MGQSFNWEEYGFRLHSPQGTLPNDQTCEIAITALVSGLFKVPEGSMLVSAVYAVSVAKPVLKPLVIEVQHCVDLRTTGQTGCLKFVRAPLKAPYQFSVVEGGAFSVGSRYGSITRDHFSLMGIVAEMSNGDTNDSENGEGGENGSGPSPSDTESMTLYC